MSGSFGYDFSREILILFHLEDLGFLSYGVHLLLRLLEFSLRVKSLTSAILL